MKHISSVFIFMSVSTFVFGQSNSENADASFEAPNKSEYTSHEDYSAAKKEWVLSNEPLEENEAMELEVIILEGDEAEKNFIHPTSGSSELIRDEEIEPISEPVMPELR